MIPSSSAFYLLGAVPVVWMVLKLWRILALFVKGWWRSVEERCDVYQVYKIPEFNESFQENLLFKQVWVYVSSLNSLEDSDFANLFASRKPSDFSLQLDSGQAVHDCFLAAKISWKLEPEAGPNRSRTFLLKIRKKDKRRILRSYLQHVQSIADEIESKKREVRLFTNVESGFRDGIRRWRSVPFTHPSTIDTIAMDSDLKNKVRSDLESFVKAKQYYHRLGRVWKRSYLLYGPAGTGKTSFVAAMAKFLGYDLYDVDLSRVDNDWDLKSLLLQTTGKSVVVIEDLDRFLAERSSKVSLSGILNFMDGIFSCCGEERVMVFTMNSKDDIDPCLLRPGRLDVHIYFPLCDFSAFKSLASSYLGVKDHKLFPHVEEVFQTGATMSPAEIGEILMVNRTSPSRALKSVISALQSRPAAKLVRRLSDSGRGDDLTEPPGSVPSSKDGVPTVREFRKLYGLLRIKSNGSRRGGAFDLEDKEAS